MTRRIECLLGMASVPPQHPAFQSQRSLSAPQEISASTSDDSGHITSRPESSPVSDASEVPTAVLLNKPDSSITSTFAEQTPLQDRTYPETEEPRKCWICFADETEDTPTSSAWRSPCPCALTAHESCLLDWVADLEAPTSRRRAGSPKKIQCPQCKKDIVIARPRSLVVEGVGAVERVASRLVVPGIILTIAGSIYTGCWVHGLSSVYFVFGPDDFRRLLEVDFGKGVSAKWAVGIPLIPVVLVLSRTTIADSFLPVLPIVFFASKIPDARGSTMDFWPPSAAMTIATLPYIRGVYNEIYKRLFAEREQKWIKAVQPRSAETPADGTRQQEAEAEVNGEEAEGDGGFELNLQVEIFDGVEEPNVQMQDGQEQANANPVQDQLPAARPNNLILSTSRAADAIIGALCFPVIASVMGRLIKVSLPRKWTTDPGGPLGRHRPGLLQTIWGRSIMGGCLFVVMKDTLLLYSRYRIAQDHRKRSIVNYDRSKGKSPRA